MLRHIEGRWGMGERVCMWTIKVMVIMMRKDDYDGEYDNDD
jgi:hypothetical protein